MTKLDKWAWWRAALRGDFGPVHENEPQTGFYRRKTRDEFSPVAIWQGDDGAFLAEEAGSPADALALWTWVCRNPVTVEAYDRAVAGEGWADLPPAVGHNLGLDALETLRIEFEGERMEVDRVLSAGPPRTDEDADRLSNWVQRVTDIGKRADAERVKEKRPHDDAAAAVQQRWKPLVDDAGALVRAMKASIGEYLREKQRKEAIARAAAAEKGAPVRPQQNAKAGSVGRKIALRTVRTAQIDDIKAASAYFAAMDAPPPDFVEMIKRLAQRVLSAGVQMPGARLIETQEAA